MNSILIGIAGGTGSGKTSLAKGILADYGTGEVTVIEQDSYYKDLSHILYEVRAARNYDHPDDIDIVLFKNHLISLLARDSVQVPIYVFPLMCVWISIAL